MNKDQFQNIYINYTPKEYPHETIESVYKCCVKDDVKNQAISKANQHIKLSKADAICDVKDFFNVLKRVYSGYDFFLGDEKSDELENQIINKIKKRFFPKITNSLLFDFIYSAINPYITDTHFSMYVFNKERFFRKLWIAYVSDIIVKKENESYRVVNQNDYFEADTLFNKAEIQDFLLPTLFISDDFNKNDEFFLLGIFSNNPNPVTEISLKNKTVPYHRIKSDLYEQKEDSHYVENEDYVIANHKTYSLGWNEALINQYFEDGCKYKNKKYIVLNVAGNTGGSSDYPENFYKGFNGLSETFFKGAYLKIEDCVKEYELKNCDDSDAEKGTYEGNLFVIMNKKTASSAEMAVSPAFGVKNKVFVGSATSGCCNFGELAMYQLQNSGIIFFNGHKVFHHDLFDECRGFLPDYWLDTENPVEFIENYIKRIEE